MRLAHLGTAAEYNEPRLDESCGLRPGTKSVSVTECAPLQRYFRGANIT